MEIGNDFCFYVALFSTDSGVGVKFNLKHKEFSDIISKYTCIKMIKYGIIII